MIEKCTHFNTYYYRVHWTTTIMGDNDQCSLRINGNIVYTIHGLVFRHYRVCDQQMKVKLINFNTGSYCYP